MKKYFVYKKTSYQFIYYIKQKYYNLKKKFDN